MQHLQSPAALDPATVDALTTVRAWSRAFNDRDRDRLLALAATDIRLHGHRGVEHGQEAVRRLLALQSYGVARHIRPLRYLAQDATIAVEALIELRWVEGGELADSTQGVGVFEVRQGRVSSFCQQRDLLAACRAAGWPPAAVPPLPTSPFSATKEGR